MVVLELVLNSHIPSSIRNLKPGHSLRICNCCHKNIEIPTNTDHVAIDMKFHMPFTRTCCSATSPFTSVQHMTSVQVKCNHSSNDNYRTYLFIYTHLWKNSQVI